MTLTAKEKRYTREEVEEIEVIGNVFENPLFT